MKGKDSPNFIKDILGVVVLRQKYLLSRTKIFYLFDKEPLASGLLDMEELAIPDEPEDGD